MYKKIVISSQQKTAYSRQWNNKTCQPLLINPVNMCIVALRKKQSGKREILFDLTGFDDN